jgi:hypothetical protein
MKDGNGRETTGLAERPRVTSIRRLLTTLFFLTALNPAHGQMIRPISPSSSPAQGQPPVRESLFSSPAPGGSFPIYADQYCATPCPDLGAAVNAAIAQCPTVAMGPNRTNNCIVSLENFRGIVPLRTQIVVSNNTVSLRGPGKSQLVLNCSYVGTGLDDTAGCIRIKNVNFGGNYNVAPTFSGFWVQSSTGNTINQVGIHVGDIFQPRFYDVAVFGFAGSNNIGWWWDNRQSGAYSEQISMVDCIASDNTIGMRYSVNGGGSSFGYGYYAKVFIQPGSGQTGLLIDGGTNFAAIYHSFVNWIFEDLNAKPTPIFLRILSHGALLDNEYVVMMEDQDGQAGSVMMNLAFNAAVTGFGQWQMWNRGSGANVLNIAGTACGGSIGSTPCDFRTVLFNVEGKVDANNGQSELGWSPVQGNLTLGRGWGNNATVGNVRGQWKQFQFTVTSEGTGQAPDPTITVNFPSTGSPGFQVLWRNPPMYQCQQLGGTNALSSLTGSQGASIQKMTLTWKGTPVASNAYVLGCIGASQ